jgi:hypothetical protein
MEPIYPLSAAKFLIHVTTAHGTLRHNGLNVGKKVYLGGCVA